LTIACVFPIAPLRLPTLRKCELLLAHATVRDHQRDPVGRHLLLSGLRSPGGGTDCPTGVASQKHRLCMSRLDIQGVARSDGVVGFAGFRRSDGGCSRLVCAGAQQSVERAASASRRYACTPLSVPSSSRSAGRRAKRPLVTTPAIWLSSDSSACASAMSSPCTSRISLP